MLDRLNNIFTSLKLTVALLALGLVLVFWGTLAQVELGLYKAQNEFFRSFFVFERLPGLNFRVPFPGGYCIGWLLLINLFAAHFRYYQPGKRKYGIVMIHLGVVLLLFGQLLTDVLSSESTMHLRNGETKNYSEAARQYELVVIDTTAPDLDKVAAISARRLLPDQDITHPEIPFTVRVHTFYGNSLLAEKETPGYTEIKTTAGFGSGIWWRSLPHETDTDKRDIPSGIVELLTPAGTLGTYLISGYLTRPQEFTFNGRTYQLALWPQRFYKPFQIHLVEFKHEKYLGTEIPKNFSSRIRLQRPDTGEDRELLIYMNNPLRYNGETYYQASFDTDNQGTILQVVRNPSWLTPYFSCVLVGAGLITQFLTHLVGFAKKRKVNCPLEHVEQALKGRFARIYELYQASQKGHPANYFECTVNDQDEGLLKHRFESVERAIEHLPAEAWRELIKKVANYVHVRNPLRCWQQLWDALHEAKGFLMLQERGYTNIQFLPEGNGKMPDLEAKDGRSVVLLEVKTVNVSDDEIRLWQTVGQEDRELFRRIASGQQEEDLETPETPYSAARSVCYGLPDTLKKKVQETINHALEQIRAHPQSGSARQIVLLLTRLDLDYRLADENRAALQQFIVGLNGQYGDVEIVHESVDWGW